MEITYDLYYNSIKNNKDEIMKNGDFIVTKFLENEQLLFLALADGVGSTADYSMASKMICEKTLDYFFDYCLTDKSLSTN